MGQAASSLAMGLSGIGGAYASAQAATAQGEFTKSQMDTNARLADIQADDTIRRGDKSAAMVKRQGKQMIGAQRASLAAQGVELDSGSALDVQTDTAKFAENDALTVKNNAWREAFGYKVDALNSTTKGGFAQMAGRNEAGNTLLTGGLNFLSYGAKAASEFSSGGKGKK